MSTARGLALGLLLLATAGTVGGVACGGSEPVIEPPPECDVPPTYAQDVAPIVERACIRCHSEMITGPARNGAPEGLDYDRFALFPDRAAMAAFVDAITSGRQPPPTLSPPLPTTADERALVSAWRTCGYLE